MKAGKVIGNIWATRKDEKLSSLKLLIVKPINFLDEKQNITPIIAADTIGAGIGETVLIVSGSSARSAVGDMSAPFYATVIAIVDDKEIDKTVL
ncbi:MAG: EutN/CcmL family microcompartment protein [Oscillospiraceae bacterium]